MVAHVAERPAKIEHFTQLEVWKMAHETFLAVLKDLDGLPRSRTAAILTDQMIRSIGSIGANIAEGFNRSKAKFLNSLEIALGETHESENWLYKLRDAGLLDRDRANDHVRQCIRIGKMLSALMRSIRSRPDR
ncbi:MAG: four helix bundle protein [Thermoguttaceae bacterium]|jgi:four helix bundle protein|nr:four helix bundle protein [Thermoguttaceae bacterium]